MKRKDYQKTMDVTKHHEKKVLVVALYSFYFVVTAVGVAAVLVVINKIRSLRIYQCSSGKYENSYDYEQDYVISII
ncbi:hypothetical protein GQX74_005915 [Glossina fuscipes]|nr:hypothetical protein GQX74_005915 [Glossina fuscipes]